MTRNKNRYANPTRRFKETRRHRRRTDPFRPTVEKLETRLAPANVDVLSYHNDLLLTGQNLQEQILHPGPASDPTALNATNFGTLFSSPIDGQAYAMPLYKSNLAIPGMGTHNVAFIATEHDSVYAFDADNGMQLWQRIFIDPANGITTIPYAELSTPDLFPEIGITGSPVIDPTPSGPNNDGTLYVVVKTKEVRNTVAHYVQKLHALDLATGQEKFGGPYLIGDTTVGGPDGGYTDTTQIYVNGTGGGADSTGKVHFNAAKENNRMALQLVGNIVYVAYASHADFRPYHGWVIGFDKTTLQPVKVFNTAPNADGVAIWESGGGLSFDPQGNMYFAVGNGFGANAFDPAHGNYSESVLKIDPTPNWTPTNPQMMRVVDYFTPFNWQQLDNQDADLGSGGAILLPDSVGSTSHPHLMVETGKQGVIYLIDRDNLGQFTSGGPDHVVQTVTAGQTGVWGNPSFFQVNATSGIIYYHGSGDFLKGYRITNGHIDTTSILVSTFRSLFPGEQPVPSADGTADPLNPVNGIVWELQVDNAAGRIQGVGDNTTAGPATLRAFSTTNLTTELYDSNQTGQRDFFGGSVKFTVPVVTNGHVLVGTADHFSVLGLFPAETAAPAAPSNLMATLHATTQGPQVQLNWTNPSPNPGHDPTGIEIFRSTDGTNFTLYNTVNRNLATFTDTGPFQVGQRYYYRVEAANQRGESPASNTVNILIPIPPAVLTVLGTGASSLGLSWTPVTNDHYDIERSTDGTNFSRVTTLPGYQTTYTDTGLTPGLYTYRIHAFGLAADSLSNVQGAWVGPTFDHSANFSNTTDLTFNGSAVPTTNLVELTNDVNQTGSFFSNTRITVGHFTTSFQVRLHEGTQPNYADGFTFVIQANSPSALGQGLAGIGYQGIGHSIAVKFSTFQHTGDPAVSTTGLVLNGASPAGGMDTTAMNGPGLNSQDIKQITLTYDGTTLTERIEDILTHQVFTTTYTVNIPQVIGSDTAYIGITGATGTSNYWEKEDILNWSFMAQVPVPGAPTNLRQAGFTSSALDLTWNGNSYNETGFQVERSIDGTTFTPIGTTTAMTFEDVGLRSGTYFYRVKASNGAGSSPYSNTLQLGLPSPILTQHQDIGTSGDPGVTGNATFANNTYSVTGGGSDVWNTADHFQYLYRPLVGDGEIVARVVTEGFADPSTKAGVMIRETLSADSKNAFTLEFPQQGRNAPTFQWRPTTGAATQEHGPAPNASPPIWVRVVRVNNDFSGYYAHDNGDGTHGPWTLLGTETFVMSPAAYFGLAVTSHSNGTTITATFDNLQILPATLQTSRLDVTPSAFAVNPGTAVNITVKALDPFNNVVTGYRGIVHFTSSDPMVTLPDYTFTAADNGVHTFSVTPRTLGRQTFSVTDTATNVIQGATAVLVTSDVIPTSLVLAGFTSPVRTGAQASFTVTARDANGQTLTGYRGVVHFTSSDPRAQLPNDYTFNATDMGMHTFMATLNTPGTQSITATDPTFGISGSQSNIVVATPPALTSVTRSAAVLNQGGTLTVSGAFADGATGLTHQIVVSWGDNTTNTTLNLAAGTFTFSTGHQYTQPGNFEIHVTLMAADNTSDALILTATAAAITPPAGLIDWWTGDGNNPATAPDIAGNNPGTLNGGVTYTAGKVGNAFTFDGNSNRGSYVNVPNAASLNVTTGTWDFWFKSSQTNVYVGLMGKSDVTTSLNGITMQIGPDGHARVEVKSGSATTLLNGSTVVNNGQFHHMALTFQSGGPAILYVDGQMQDSQTAPTFSFSSMPLRLGTMLDSFWTPLNGQLDEVQIFNRVLSATEIQGIVNAAGAGQLKGVRVLAVPPPAIASVARSAAVINEGGSVTLNASFTDVTSGVTHQAVISWGDNTANTMVSLVAGVFNVNATHVYTEEGNYQIQVTVSATNGGSDTMILPVTANAIAPPAGLADWWTGDGNSATTAPDIAGNNPGTVNGGVTYVPGEVGNAFSFDGNNASFVNIPDGTSLNTTTGTWDFWMKTTQTSGFVGLVGKHDAGSSLNGITMQMDQGHARVEVKGPGPTLLLTGTTTINNGQWHHMALSFQSGGATTLYIDGHVEATGTAPTFSFNATPLRFGRMLDTFWTAYNGQLDEVQIFNRVLSAAEIQGIFNAGSAGQIKGVRGTDPSVVGTGGFIVTQTLGLPIRTQTVATFTDPGGPEALADYSASINWGDNTTPSSGTISLPVNGVFTIQGNHPYTQVGTYPITVTIHHDSASDIMVTGTGLVSALVLNVTGYPSPTTAGDAHQFTVTVRDAFGGVATNYTGVVHFSSTDPHAVLPSDYTFTAQDAGVHMFGATLETAGTQSLTTTDVGTGASGSQAGITVNPAPLSTFTVADFPSPVPAGTLGAVTVTAVDAYNNVITGYVGTVHLTSSDPQAVLEADHTFTANDNGQYAFGVVLKTAGTQSITATDTSSGINGSQVGIVVTPLAAVALRIDGFPSPATAGTPGTATATAIDIYGNTAPTYTGTVHVTTTDPRATVPPDFDFHPSDMGVVHFQVDFFTPGVQSITVTDIAQPSITGSQTGIMVVAAPASVLVVSGFPSPVVAGTQGQFTVTAMDPYGNVATGYLGTVTFTSNDPQASLPADYTFQAADAGMKSFQATLRRAGLRSITATDTVTSTVTGTQDGINVQPAAVSAFSVSGFPSPVRAGTPSLFTVRAIDPYNNTVPSYVGVVHFSTSDPAGQMPDDYTFTAADSGMHTFGAILTTVGTQSITASDDANQLQGTQTGIMVIPGRASLFIVEGFPSPTPAGAVGTFRVTVFDAYGNQATDYTGTVTFSSSDPAAQLPTDYTFMAGDNGMHDFAAALNTVGTQSITATDTVDSSVIGTQDGIEVVAASIATGRTSAVQVASIGAATTAAGNPAPSVDRQGNTLSWNSTPETSPGTDNAGLDSAPATSRAIFNTHDDGSRASDQIIDSVFAGWSGSAFEVV
jgi:hypothetical protein